MKFRQRLGSTGTKAERSALEEYLRRAGFLAEALLVAKSGEGARQRYEAERALQKAVDCLPLPADVQAVSQLFRFLFGMERHLILHPLRIGRNAMPAVFVALNGMADRTTAMGTLLPLLNDLDAQTAPILPDEVIEWLATTRSPAPDTRLSASLNEAVLGVLDGQVALFLQGAAHVLLINVPGWERRSITEPETEGVLRGPREGFVESLATNMSMIRRRLRITDLRIETLRIGDRTRTFVAVAYIQGLCKQPLIDEVMRRLQRIKTDGILDTGYLEEFIEDTTWTVFPQVKTTERPDVVVAGLLEGRFAVLADGSPFALVAPTSIVDMLQAPDDYYERFPVVVMLRTLRWAFATVSLLGPALYVALTTFHQEMLPTPLLLSIIAAREGVPFPAVLEAMIMEITFEAIREAGVRLPKPVGQTVSIVGALVIGEAAVQAGIVSAPMVIVVAVTGIASFIIPKYSAAIALRILRFSILILAGTFGALGITLGIMLILLHLLSLRSFGSPYYAPLGPFFPKGQKDVIVRAPHWAMKHRPESVEQLDPVRTAHGLGPGP